MKTALLLSTLFATPAHACLFFNTSAYESAYLTAALRSEAYAQELYKLGTGSDVRVVNLVLGEDRTLTAQLSNKCTITVQGKNVPAKPGEVACLNLEFKAQTNCP